VEEALRQNTASSQVLAIRTLTSATSSVSGTPACLPATDLELPSGTVSVYLSVTSRCST